MGGGVEPVERFGTGKVAQSVGGEDGVGARAGIVDLCWKDEYDCCA